MFARLPARAALWGGVAAALVVLTGCGVGQSAAVAEPTTAAGLGPAASAGLDAVRPGTSAAPPGTPASQPVAQNPQPDEPAPGYPATARAYAEATVTAWSTGDLSRLADLTTPGVHEQFLEMPGELATDWIHHRCDGVAGSSYCTLRNGDGDSVTLRVSSQSLGGAHAVRELSASITTYPAGGEAYAREFVRAWATANTPRMRALARPDVVVAVNNNHQQRPQGTWALGASSEHGGAGLLIVHIDINEGAVRFTLHVGTTLLGGRRAVVGYQPEP